MKIHKEPRTKRPDSLCLRTKIAETWAKRQLIPLKTDNQTIQARDYSVICLNAHQLTAFCPTLTNRLRLNQPNHHYPNDQHEETQQLNRNHGLTLSAQ